MAGLTTRDLAASAGWASHTYLLRLLAGEVPSVRADRAERLAAAVGADVDDLFTPAVSTIPSRVDKPVTL